MLDTFKAFMADEEAWNMYITGVAGTGKTTNLRELIEYCQHVEIPTITAAFTHKACGVLAEKLPQDTTITTLHSFLNKRPTINGDATSVKTIQSNMVFGETQHQGVLFVDEYSMVGEKDYMDLIAAQDPEYGAIPKFKVVWIGDPHQLPPVGDTQAISPRGEYCVELTHIYRQAGDNPLTDTLSKLIAMIEGAAPMPLEPHKTFARGQDIVQNYVSNGDVDKIILAYTNKRVEEINCQIMGRSEPQEGDYLFSPTTKKHYTFVEWVRNPRYISLPFGDDLYLNSKYKTLEYLIQNDTRFASVVDDEGEELVLACAFGHYQFKTTNEDLKAAAAQSNARIEKKFKGYRAAGWANANKENKLARARAKAWRDFLTFDECVVCLDFAHAMTVHKSQGSTYGTVYIDSDDLHICAHRSMQTYLKLMYVAVSRASKRVETN